ncbi:Rhomboid-like protein 20 [Ananas comosus]|uniref:Rhomboid-like protein 20 n=1 Tax=Ananas comosus TaxID=4615 RepID=A0A199VKD2_ANACO|nr:Rhomboid-like protein 20 [Ananas comosus]
MNGGPSGFHNAPVARAFVLACVLLTAVFGVRGRALRLGLSYQDIIKNFQLWRIFASVFAFSSTPELLFGVYLLYYFRVFERQMGSNKYSVFVLFSLIVSSLFEIIALMLFKDPTANVIASGPYGLIFSSFVPFYFDIPVTSRFRIFGLQFGDKSFIYLAGLQVIVVSRISIFLGAVYVIVNYSVFSLLLSASLVVLEKVTFTWPMWNAGWHPISPQCIWYSRDKVPKRRGETFLKVFRIFWGKLIANVTKWEYCRKYFFFHRPSNSGKSSYFLSIRNYPPVARAPPPEPPESSIAMLVSMGFDSNAARQALMQARNDINVATNILLEAQSR